jgi:talin
MNAVKDVAIALQDLINATKLASGKPINDPAMNDLKESAKVMVQNVTSLLKTVKAVEDEHTRGTRAMEATIEAITQEVKTINYAETQSRSSMIPSTPEDLIRVTRGVTVATSKAVAAGASNSQSDIVAAANVGRRAISEMLTVCRSVAWGCAETADLRQRTLDSGAAVGIAYRDLLQGILQGCSAEERMQLSRRVAKCVTDLVSMAQLLKGSDWVDPEDPTVIAENELLGAAASIDAAAKKLASLRPRTQDVKQTDDNLNFDEMILEAAKSIMAASAALIRAANAAQRELIDQGKVSKRPLTSSDDGQWSEGLISAARLVAAATHSLVEAAQNLVLGVGTEEMLISAAKQVASTTAQLLIACKVKSDPNSESGRRLQAAGNAVIKSTDNLVRAAQQALEVEEEHTLKLNRSMVDGIAQEINARSHVLKMEKELDEARNRLKAIREAKYRQRNTAGYATDESDFESSGAHYGFQTPSPTHFHRPVHTPPSPSFQNQLSSTTYQEQNQQQMKRSNLLTANAIPRPYNSNNMSSGSGSPSPQPIPVPQPMSPIQNRIYETTTIQNPNLNAAPLSARFDKLKLEQCVQDLHEKTFGKGSPNNVSTFKTTVTKNIDNGADKGTNYEGYTTRYETRTFHTSDGTSPLVQEMSRMNLQSTSNGAAPTSLAQLNGQTSTLHSSSSTSTSHQKIMQKMEIKESRHVEMKSENRNYRLQ